jgi:hypothetical protein
MHHIQRLLLCLLDLPRMHMNAPHHIPPEAMEASQSISDLRKDYSHGVDYIEAQNTIIARAMAAHAKTLAAEYAAREKLWRDALVKIRNSAGDHIMVCTAEGHSYCVHIANAALLSAHPAAKPGATQTEKI